MNREETLKTTRNIAREAGSILVEHFHREEKGAQKKPGLGNVALDADRESEFFIKKEIQRHFPSHSIFGEEGTNVSAKSEYLWSIDPLDGTYAYLLGLPWFTVSMGLLFKGQPLLGVIHAPFGQVGQPQTYWALKGDGAYCDGQQLSVSNNAKLDEAIIAYDNGHSQRAESIDTIFRPLSEKVRYALVLACCTTNLCSIAAGRLAGYVHLNLEHWDIAAGTVIVEEAGGKVTDVRGNPLTWETGKKLDYLASNGHLHDQFLEIINN